MSKKKIKKPTKPKYSEACGKGKKGCRTVLTIVAGRHCSKGCHRRKSWEDMTGKSFESRLAA